MEVWVDNNKYNHLTFCCINCRRYVCCNECNVVSNECDEPTPCLVRPVGAHSGEVMYFWIVCFRGELIFLNYAYICMCVVNNQSSLSFVFDSVYVDLGMCDLPWSVCDFVLVPYVDAVSVMRVLLFVLHVCMLRECEGARVTEMLV